MSVENYKKSIEEFKRIIKEDGKDGIAEFIDEKLFNKIKKNYNNLVKEAKTRGSLFKNIVEGICEGLDMSKKVCLWRN